MTHLHKTIETLIRHNIWRRGEDEEQVHPQQIGEAIDHALSVLMAVENLIEQRGRHNTEIAYRALENACGKDAK
jgi:hypothetical protein